MVEKRPVECGSEANEELCVSSFDGSIKSAHPKCEPVGPVAYSRCEQCISRYSQ